MSQLPDSSLASQFFQLITELRQLALQNLNELLQDQQIVDPQNYEHNAKALASRFIGVVCRPADLAPLVVSIYSLFLSFLSRRGQSEIDFLYPMSSLARQQSSGRLARLILDHSRSLQQPNLRDAVMVEQGFDPPRVVVIDLNEVPQNVIDRGYSVPADVYGFMVTFMILEALLALYAYALAPINTLNKNLLGLFVKLLFNEETFFFFANWILPLGIIMGFCAHAILGGDGTLTLVRRSGLTVPGCAVFLDHELTVILFGSQSILEAIMESGFSISPHPLFEFLKKKHPSIVFLRYELLKAFCNGFFLTFLVGSCLAFHPSLITTSVSLVLTVVTLGVWSRTQAQEIVRDHHELWLPIFIVMFACAHLPPWLLFFTTAGEQYLLKGTLEFRYHFPVLVPITLYEFFLLCYEDFPVHTTKFLDVLGNPPTRRWEFDTLAAAVTFQCLVLCRGLPCPIRTMNVLGLLNVFIPDQTDVWMAWKNRVADRITYEVEISFAPTLPTFGDERQERLKKLLDQAQIGYDMYRNFYDWRVSESS